MQCRGSLKCQSVSGQSEAGVLTIKRQALLGKRCAGAYRDLILAAHHGLSAPVIWVWDNLNVRLAPQLADFAEENKAWLRVYGLAAYTPDLNPAEGIWSLLKQSMASFAAAGLKIEPW